MAEWPLKTPPWDDRVTPKDAWHNIGATDDACVGCDQPIGAFHVKRVGQLCWRLRSRIRSRIGLIALFHAKGRSETRDLALADRVLGWRDALIDDLQPFGHLDRKLFNVAVSRHRAELAEGERLRARFRNLDLDWDGEGLAPSLLAALHDCVMKTGGYFDPIFGSPVRGRP